MMRLCGTILAFFATVATAQEGVWRAQTSPTTENLTGVSFGSATTGVAAGSGATIIRSTDGGIRWERVTGISGLDATKCCSQVRFLNAQVAWLIGSQTMLRSGSTGSGWFGFTYSDGRTRRSVVPTSSETAWVVGNSSSGGRSFFRYTIVGNNTSSNLWGHADNDTLYDVDFTDPDNGLAVGSPGRIIRITSGTTANPVFTNLTSGTTAALRGIDMVDANNGWIAGDQGTILHTTDGGTTWTKQTSGTVNSLRAVSFKNTNEGFAVGTAGLILATTDGGTTWRMEPSGVSNDLYSVFHGAVSVAVGAGGTIVRRTTAAGGCDYSLNPRTGLYSQAGGSPSFTVTAPSNCQWTATTDVSWITVNSSGTGNGTVNFSIAANPAATAREGHVNVGNATYSAVQYGTSGSCSHTLSPATTTFAGSGGSGTVNVATLTACIWFVISDVPWITMDGVGSGTGNGTATYKVSPNTSGATRTGTLSISSERSVRVTVTQIAGTPRRRAVGH